jgi:hypothetical protein
MKDLPEYSCGCGKYVDRVIVYRSSNLQLSGCLQVIQGPLLLNKFPAPLDKLPCFERVPDHAALPVRGTIASVLG